MRQLDVFVNDRKAICRKLRIDENDLFGILMAMADKDFIGAQLSEQDLTCRIDGG